MRLLSITLRRYRIHKEFKVEFNPSLTLIGGPNETGKSTIVEAIHRILFIKAKGNTKNHREMKSLVFMGEPEVELEFTLNNKRHILLKRFGGNGTAILTIEGKTSLQGSEAEEELVNILGEENEWAHLWVWQGKAGEDPSVYATDRSNQLIQQLQNLGAAAILQSALDNQLAQKFENAVNEIFIQEKKPRKGSDLERADTDCKTAQEIFSRASDRLQNLETYANELDSAEMELPSVNKLMIDFEGKKIEIDKRESEYNVLKDNERDQRYAVQTALDKFNSLSEANKSILKFVRDINVIELSLKPQQLELAKLADAKRVAKENAETAERESLQAMEAFQNTRINYDLASALSHQYEKTETHAKLE